MKLEERVESRNRECPSPHPRMRQMPAIDDIVAVELGPCQS